MRQRQRLRATTLVFSGVVTASLIVGCGGGSHFQNRPRPAVPLELTGVITDSNVTVSPNNIGGGPIRLVITNETQQSHTVELDRVGNAGTPVHAVVGPLNPLQPATLEENLSPGQYTVSTGSSADAIAPATVTVGAGGVCAGGQPAPATGQCPNSSRSPLLP